MTISGLNRPSQSTSVTSHPASRKGSPTDPVPEQRNKAFGMFYRCCDYCCVLLYVCKMRIVWFGIHTIRTRAFVLLDRPISRQDGGLLTSSIGGRASTTKLNQNGGVLVRENSGESITSTGRFKQNGGAALLLHWNCLELYGIV